MPLLLTYGKKTKTGCHISFKKNIIETRSTSKNIPPKENGKHNVAKHTVGPKKPSRFKIRTRKSSFFGPNQQQKNAAMD